MFESLPYSLSRLSLRTLRSSDLENFYAYRSDPAVARFQGWEPMTVGEAAEYLKFQSAQSSHAPGTWRQLAIAELTADSLVGDMGVWLSADRRKAEVGLSISPNLQGNGYGSESLRGVVELLFASTLIVEIEASADIRNLSCLAALRRAGFTQVDARQAEYKGELCTEHVFVCHRREG